MTIYYNPNKKEQKSLIELKKQFNASIPINIEKFGDWHFIHDTEQPPITATQRLIIGPIELKNKKYVQTWTIEDIPAEELAAQQAIEAAKRAEEERLPDLEDAVAELGSYVDESVTDNTNAILELADYITSLEERITILEGGKE